MRRYTASLVAFTFLLLTVTALAQTAPSSSQKGSTSTTTTTTTTTQTTASGPEHNIEGCIIKESADFFLLPEHGAPFKLQSSQNLASDEGHKVMVSGKESALSAAGMPISSPSDANAPAASGSGSDLHHLAKRQLVIDSVKSIADTCPLNWNPGLRR
jgi:hypothetical protein